MQDEDRYVPAGWVWQGGDALAPDAVDRRRVFVPGFVLRRDPVTVREYVGFLEALVRAGRIDEARRRAPGETDGVSEIGRPAITVSSDGSVVPGGDHLYTQWDPEWPVTLIDWSDASAYVIDDLAIGKVLLGNDPSGLDDDLRKMPRDIEDPAAGRTGVCKLNAPRRGL